MTTTIGCMIRPFAPHLAYPEICQQIAAAGYTDLCASTAIVNASHSKDEVLAAKKAALDAGVQPSMLMGHGDPTLPLDEAVDQYKKLIDNAALYGARWLLELGTSKTELAQQYVAILTEIAPYAGQMGIQITMKPHGGITLTVDDLSAIYEQVNNPAFGIAYDPGNIIYYTVGELRPETEIDRMAPLVSTLIIKDCKIEDGKPDVMINPGEGLVDFRAVWSGLVGGGFQGPCYVECVAGDTLAEVGANAAQARAFVQQLVG